MPRSSSAPGVLVDTSVFIDFFRGRPVPRFEELLLANAIRLSRFVRLELLQGVRKAERRQLDFVLGGIPTLEMQPGLFKVAESMLGQLRGSGLTIGTIDLLIGAEARTSGCVLYSLDSVFRKFHALGLIEALER